MKRASHLVASLTLAAALLWVYRIMFPSAESAIRRELADLVALANTIAHEEGIGRLATAAKVGRHFTERVRVDAGSPYGRIDGRDNLIAFAARGWQPGWRIGIERVRVFMEDDRSARATMTATFTGVAPDREADYDARDLMVTLQWIEERWLITTIDVRARDAKASNGGSAERLPGRSVVAALLLARHPNRGY